MTVLRYLVASIFFLLSFFPAYSQVSLDWVARYNNMSFGYDGGLSLFVDDSSYVYSTGSSYGTPGRQDMVVLKYSPLGINQWTRRFTDGTSFTAGFDVKVDKFYNVYVAGTGIFKYDINGILLWHELTDGRYNSLAVDDSGNCYVTGTNDGGSKFVTKKFSSNGDLRWERNYQNLISGNTAEKIALDKDRNVLITGRSSQTTMIYEFATIKYSNDGNQIWLRRYSSGNDDFPYGLALDDSNNVYVTGWNGNVTTDALTIKYSPDGDTIWKAVYDGGSGDVGYDVEVDSLGCVYVGGITFGNDYLTLKYDNLGNLMWSRIQPGYQLGYQFPVVKVDKSRNVYMSYVTMRTGNYSNYAVVKYNNDGVQKWIAEYNNGGISSNYIYDLTLDSDANVYATGSSGISIATVKFVQEPTSVNPISNDSPVEFKLEQNFPNPFNPTTVIRYSIPSNVKVQTSDVKLVVYNNLGKELVTLVNEKQNAGTYEVDFNGSGLSSGVYFYKLITEDFTDMKRMILLK